MSNPNPEHRIPEEIRNEILYIFQEIDFSFYGDESIRKSCRSYKAKYTASDVIEEVRDPMTSDLKKARRVEFVIVRGMPDGDIFRIFSFSEAGTCYEFV